MSLGLDAQIRIVPRETLDHVNDPQLSAGAAAMKFDCTHIEGGRMDEDSGVKVYEYSFVNAGKDTLVVERLVSTCSCASAVCSRKAVLPGEQAVISLKYNPKGHVGRFERKVFVYVAEDRLPYAVLKLSVEVERGRSFENQYPVAMGNIRVRRMEVKIDKGVRAVERCSFVNVSGKTLKLECESLLLPPCLTFRTEPETVEAGGEGDIVITYDPSKGGEREKMPVLLKNLGVPPSQASIVVKLNEL